MNIWHMQLHPSEPDWSRDDIFNLVKIHGVIGLGEQWEGDRGQPNAFKNNANKDDIVVIRHQGPLCIVRITSQCLKNNGENKIDVWFPIYRRVELLDSDALNVKEEYEKKFNIGWSKGIYAPATFQNANNWNFAKYWYSKTINKINMEKYINLLDNNYNLILTGAPGTGKTYLAKQIAQQIAAQNTYNPKELLGQIIGKFKHSGEKTERLNELRSDFLKRFPKEKLKDLTLEQYCIGDGGKDNFCWWIERGLTALGKYFPGSSRSYLVYRNKESLDYVFTGFLKKIKASDINITNESLMNKLASEISECVEKKKNTNNYFGDSFLLKILSTYYPDEFFPINSKTYLDNVINLFDLENKKDILEQNKVVYNFYKIACKDRNDITVDEFAYILYSNFDLKTGVAVDSLKQSDSKEDYGFVQFHPSYDYTDFVEGLRPIKDENGNVGFERKDGVFKEFCINALNNPNKNFVFIIDEINRGEISKIFGELFFSIDPGYRGKKGRVRTQYANMQNTPNDFDDKLGIIDDNNFGHFFVPENVYIIGTMNDIDRSVESMDFAMRRRFAFKEIKAIDSMKMLDDEKAWEDEQDNIVKPSLDVLEKLKNRMTNLNNMIWHEAKTDEKEKCIEGLSSAYHIGAAYFLKLKNYADDADGGFDNLWDNHIKGLLVEYLRGMQDADEKLEKLEKAYNDDKDHSKKDKDNSEENKDNESTENIG